MLFLLLLLIVAILVINVFCLLKYHNFDMNFKFPVLCLSSIFVFFLLFVSLEKRYELKLTDEYKLNPVSEIERVSSLVDNKKLEIKSLKIKIKDVKVEGKLYQKIVKPQGNQVLDEEALKSIEEDIKQLEDEIYEIKLSNDKKSKKKDLVTLEKTLDEKKLLVRRMENKILVDKLHNELLTENAVLNQLKTELKSYKSFSKYYVVYKYKVFICFIILVLFVIELLLLIVFMKSEPARRKQIEIDHENSIKKYAEKLLKHPYLKEYLDDIEKYRNELQAYKEDNDKDGEKRYKKNNVSIYNRACRIVGTNNVNFYFQNESEIIQVWHEEKKGLEENQRRQDEEKKEALNKEIDEKGKIRNEEFSRESKIKEIKNNLKELHKSIVVIQNCIQKNGQMDINTLDLCIKQLDNLADYTELIQEEDKNNIQRDKETFDFIIEKMSKTDKDMFEINLKQIKELFDKISQSL